MTEYVAGFLFNANRTDVVLVEKKRPAWQAGKFNGVGGKIEPGETPRQAMEREFLEEANHLRTDWEQFCTLRGDGFVVHFFRAFHRGSTLEETVRTMTDEAIEVVPICFLTPRNAVPNLQWLIPMALTMDHDSASSFVVSEAA